MTFSWLHVSDFHFRGGDPYDRDVVLGALVKSVLWFREQQGRRPDLLFATGDIAYAGREDEYEAASRFFDDLLLAAGLERKQLFVVPGNHDVDRKMGTGLARTLETSTQADEYFNPAVPKVHITQKQHAFIKWYNQYFDRIRTFPIDSTCGPVELAEVGGCKIGVLPLNSALFCQDDYDHAKLWIGRRCLRLALERVQSLGADLNIALVHHPLDWLNDLERANIKAELQSRLDFILRGHLHETDVESVIGIGGEALHLAAGASYQTRRWPNRAIYAAINGDRVALFPIRFEDQPQENWTVDPSLFPREPGYEKSFPISRLAGRTL
jgi:predicted phosphodiesterase